MASRAPDKAATVFVSYSHDTPAHAERVLALADRLRWQGVHVALDQYVRHPPEGWPRWTQRQIVEARFVLMICTPIYKRRFDREEPPGEGQGVAWEGLIADALLYEASTRNDKLIPVLLEDGTEQDVPLVLRAYARYRLPLEYGDLYRRLTDQPATPPLPLGELVTMDPAPRNGIGALASTPREPRASTDPPTSPPTHTAIVLDRTDAWTTLTKAATEAQAEAALAKQTQLRAAVEEALELPKGERRRGYSFTQLRASQIALPLYRTASTTLGSEHPATRALHAVIEQLARGCHRFGRPEKTEAYRAARDEASRAACSLAVVSEASATPLLETVEHELMAALVGAASGRPRRHGRWVQRRPRA